MSSTTFYKLTKMGVVLALVAGGATACHYKAGTQYAEDSNAPGADSGTRRISTTTMKSDSSGLMANSDTVAGAPAASNGGTSVATPNGSASAAKPNPAAPATATLKSVSKAKFSRGHASVTAPKIYGTADVAPQFPGGQHALDTYINKSVNYPQQAIDDDVSGVVHVSFIVDEDGHITRAKIMDAANLSDGLDQEALRVVRDMPSWTPGKVRGKSVKTRMELPISFVLES